MASEAVGLRQYDLGVDRDNDGRLIENTNWIRRCAYYRLFGPIPACWVDAPQGSSPDTRLFVDRRPLAQTPISLVPDLCAVPTATVRGARGGGRQGQSFKGGLTPSGRQ